MSIRDRAKGALIGLAVGDALGTTLEFSSPGSFEPLTDMVGGGPFDLPPGFWTDDTSMALCMAHSLVEKGFDPLDQMQRYLQWWRGGYMSSTGECFDIGGTTRDALFRFYGNPVSPFQGSTAPEAAGNGSIMRLAPVVIYSATGTLDRLRQMAGDSSRTTHGAQEAVDACVLMAFYMSMLMHGEGTPKDKEEVLTSRPHVILWETTLSPKIEAIARGSFKKKQPPEIRGTGYVVDSLEAALWAFWNSDSFEEGLLKAVNLGDDADTTGAVYGQIAGAHYGLKGIPQKWVKKVHLWQPILDLALQVYHKGEEDFHARN